MKTTTKESRKRRLQMTSLLKMRRSSKNTVQQPQIRKRASEVNYKEKHELFKTNVNTEFHQSSFYNDDQFKSLERGNEMLLVNRKNHQFYQLGESFQPQRNFKSIAIYGGINHCTCLACTEKSLELSKQEQYRSANKIKITNGAFVFGQQITNNEFHGEPTHMTGLSATQNKHGNHHELILAKKQAHLSTTAQNFNLRLTLNRERTHKAPVAYTNSFYQQNVKFQPNFNPARVVNNQNKTMGIASVTQQPLFNRLPIIEKKIHSHFRCFPNHNHSHLLSVFQGSLGSLTSSIDSVESGPNDIVTSNQFDRTFVTSQRSRFQMMNNADFYNFD